MVASVAPTDGAALPLRDPDVRASLEARWLHLTRQLLPSLSRDRRWPVSANHCFQRILLDVVTGGVWYDAIPQRPAYRHASDEVLEQAIALAEAVASGDADLAQLNRQSLAWRRARRVA